MYQRQTIITNQNGLHARPASRFVLEAKKFKSNITLGKLDKDGVNAKSIMFVLAQGLTYGTEVLISAEGIDEQSAVESLTELVRSGCGETAP